MKNAAKVRKVSHYESSYVYKCQQEDSWQVCLVLFHILFINCQYLKGISQGLRPNWPPARRAYAPEGMMECWNIGIMEQSVLG